MSGFGTFNYPIYARRWKTGVHQHPIRWLKVDRATGCVLGEYSGVAKPAATHDGVLVVPARLPGVPL